ncbi:MAG: DNA repair protein RecN [Alphaproteobacteria bacterium]|nr:DNA repair protein RecN [Alphaproteobacteria bacterium]
MLRQLSIRDIVLIDRLDISLSSGLGVLTGETGAGKSILLDSLGLALGGRGDVKLIRSGAEKSSITAVFELGHDHPAAALLAEHEIDIEDGELILRRTLSADGRGRAFVNDQAVSVNLLRQLGAHLVEIQGQHELHGLLDPATHIRLLDAFGGLQSDLDETRASYGVWQDAQARLGQAEAAFAQARADEKWLRDAVTKLEELAPQPGEEARLAEARKLAQHGAKLAEALREATDQLADEAGAEANLQRAMQRLDKVADLASTRVADISAALDRAAAETSEALRDLQSLATEIDLDPAEEAAADDRLFALRAAARRHDVEVDTLADELASLADRLAAIDTSEEEIVRLAQDVEVQKRAYLAAAETLSAGRAKAAVDLDGRVMGELEPLKLDRAVFRTEFERLGEARWGARGLDGVRFAVRTNPGSPFGPIDKVASGGELARFMLAVKVVLAASSPNRTLVFDEVDSGIGGATAAAVGRRLARLADARQVLVVTHSPQVAAVGSLHFQVTKTDGAQRAVTKVAQITDSARTEEIARMISGATITDEARAAARELIKGADAP